MSGRVYVRHKLAFPIQVDRDTLDALPSAYHVSMYVTLLRLAQAENNSAPGFKALAKQARMSAGKASGVLNELESTGIIARTRTKMPNGMDYRTVYEIMGVHGANTPVHEENPVHDMNGVHLVNTVDLQAVSSGEHRVVVADLEEQQHAYCGLVEAGVTVHVAGELSQSMPSECLRQLQAVEHRPAVRDKAATLVQAIRQEWTVPKTVERQELRERRDSCVTCDGLGFVDGNRPNLMAECPDCR